MNIAIFTPGFDTDVLKGPALGQLRMCRELVKMNHNHEFFFVHHQPYARDIYQQAHEIIVPKIPGLVYQRLRQSEIDLVLLNGLPNRIGSFLLHTYPGIKKAVFVHGTLPWVPDYAYGDLLKPKTEVERWRNNWTKTIMRRSSLRFDRIVCNSHFTKSVILNEMPVTQDSCTVIHYGLDHSVFYPREDAQTLCDRLGIQKDYIILVAVHTTRKNPETALKAYQLLREKGHNQQFVIVGAGWTKDIVGHYVSKPYIDDVILPGFLDEDDVSRLYTKASVCIFPTLHETFGMPLIEAMGCDCPVVSNQYTVVPEVTGDAALLAQDPLDSNELVTLIERIITNPSLREEMIINGKQRANQFQWYTTAEKFSQLFDELQRV